MSAGRARNSLNLGHSPTFSRRSSAHAYHAAMKLGRTLLAAIIAVAPLAWADAATAPERIVQLSYVEGQIRFQGAGEQESSALPARPLAAGDRIATDRSGRAEISLGSAAVRLDEQSALEVTELEADYVRARLDSGVALVTVRDLRDNERLEMTTPNATITLASPGDYRVEAPAQDTTFVTVHGGSASVATAAGPVQIADGQRARLSGSESLVTFESARAADEFDEWALGREEKLAQAESPNENEQNEDLSRYGEWQDDPSYGRVWAPAYTYGYDPYSYGYWQPVGNGWGWVDTSPWGPYTYYNGHWAYLHDRWYWVPVRHETHPRIPVRRVDLGSREPRLRQPIPIDPVPVDRGLGKPGKPQPQPKPQPPSSTAPTPRPPLTTEPTRPIRPDNR